MALLDFVEEKDGLMELIAPFSRGVLANEIHELMLTEEQGAGPGKTVNRVRIIGFLEVETGGIILLGDEVFIAGNRVGEVAGFSVTHMPNHMNIVIKVEKLAKPNLKLEDKVVISKRIRA